MRRRFATLVLAALFLLIGACGGDGATDGDGDGATTAPGGETAEVVMENIAFQPGELTVQSGTTVIWTNQDAVSHTTTSDDDIWDSGTMGQGDEFSFTFEETGTFSYVCTVHPQMQATVIVEG